MFAPRCGCVALSGRIRTQLYVSNNKKKWKRERKLIIELKLWDSRGVAQVVVD